MLCWKVIVWNCWCLIIWVRNVVRWCVFMVWNWFLLLKSRVWKVCVIWCWRWWIVVKESCLISLIILIIFMCIILLLGWKFGSKLVGVLFILFLVWGWLVLLLVFYVLCVNNLNWWLLLVCNWKRAAVFLVFVVGLWNICWGFLMFFWWMRCWIFISVMWKILCVNWWCGKEYFVVLVLAVWLLEYCGW